MYLMKFFVLLVGASVAGCGGYDVRKDSGLKSTEFHNTENDDHPDGIEMPGFNREILRKYEDAVFELREDRVMAGVRVRKGTKLQSLAHLRGGTILPAEFSWLKMMDESWAYAKRPGIDAVLRIDLKTKREERLPFDELRGARDARNGGGRPIGVVRTPGNKQFMKVVFLKADGRVASMIERVEIRSFEQGPQPVDALRAGGYIAHHIGEDGEPVDMIYNEAGVPISPKLTPVLRLVPDGDENSYLAFAIRTDLTRELYWPLRPDGTIHPKPDDLVGLQPVMNRTNYTPAWMGWLAMWKGADGERLAYLPRTAGIAAIIESRADAIYDDIVSAKGYDRGVELFIMRVAGAKGYALRDRERNYALHAEASFPTSGDAFKYLQDIERAKDEQAREQRRKEEVVKQAQYAQYLVEAAEREKQARERLKAEDTKRRAGWRQIDDLMRARKYIAARDLARKLGDHEGARQAILKSVEADQLSELSSTDLASVLDEARDQEAQKIRGTISMRQITEEAARRPERMWGDGGSGGGGTHTTTSTSGGGAAVQAIQDNARWQSQLNYLSGNQSWGYSDNGRIRR